jgi:hypothetical protein
VREREERRRKRGKRREESRRERRGTGREESSGLKTGSRLSGDGRADGYPNSQMLIGREYEIFAGHLVSSPVIFLVTLRYLCVVRLTPYLPLRCE